MPDRTSFSDRESEVIELLIRGKSNKQIALALGISVRTVEFHLSHIYAKLDITSRTEAVLKFTGTRLRESTGNPADDILRESAVEKEGGSLHNTSIPFFQRRFSLKNILYVAASLLLVFTLLVLLLPANTPATSTNLELSVPTSSAKPLPVSASPTPTLVVSARGQILAEMQSLVDEYDRLVQIEKQTGSVGVSQDSATGEEIFKFSGESYERIAALFEDLNENLAPLGEMYIEVYRGEFQPTPFPTQASPEENQAFYDLLLEQYQSVYNQDLATGMYIPIYDPDLGKYQPRLVGDSYARIEIASRAFEDLQNAPALAEVDQAANMAEIRRVVGKADLPLSFQTVMGFANAPLEAAVYSDDAGIKYWVDIASGRLGQIEPAERVVIPAFDAKSVDELRLIAEQFALANSPRLAELKSVLLYEEGGKGSIYTFRWDYRSKDWSGTEWAMMPPLLQVGVLADGEIVTYLDTLDLFQ